MLGWREDRINVPPAVLPVILASHICKKSQLFLRGAGTGLCFLLASFIQSIISSTCRRTPPPQLNPSPTPSQHSTPFSCILGTTPNITSKYHFLSVHPEDRDHPTDHFPSPEDAGGIGHFFHTTAIPEHFLSPKKTLKL